ncbi:MAG: IS1595 family transposase [Hyphomicrobiaceae bacterium]
MSILNQPFFHDEAAAFAKLESVLWPNGPVCPHCGGTKVYALTGVRSKASKKNPEGVERHGLKKCGNCRKQFTVRVGTVFESSHIPLHKALQAVFLLCSSKKGISSHQLHRVLEITYEAAWFLSHRIREAMRSGSLAVPMGGAGGSGMVEADETFIGRKKGMPVRNAYHHKNAVLSLVERGGEVRSFHVDKANATHIMPIVKENIAKEAKVSTDEANHYKSLGKHVAEHVALNHKAEEWARGEFTTNSVEGYFSIFKRGMKGVYQHCSEKHLHRYLAEFDFRFNNRVKLGVDDEARTHRALQGVLGKRLTYRQPDSQ